MTSRQPFHWREASLCVPAIPFLLVLGFVSGESILGAAAAGAAFSVGFGAARELRGRRWGAMIVSAMGMSIAAFIGSIAGNYFPAQLLLAGIAAAGCAALALYDEDLWWVSLQLVIALLVASYYPGSLTAALHRAEAVLIGGAIQILVVVILARLVPAASAPLPSSGAALPSPNQRLLISHIARAAICVVVALIFARAIGLANGYWAPMTAMLILKPGLHETRTRGVARFAGTLAGCLAATAFCQIVDFSRPALLIGLALTAGLSYALQKAHYAILTCAITATVVLLLSLGSAAVVANAEHRLVATLLGGIVALVVAHIAPHRLATGERRPDHVGA